MKREGQMVAPPKPGRGESGVGTGSHLSACLMEEPPKGLKKTRAESEMKSDIEN
jgi:hypothetical protein